jgi:hypothetical protein
VGVNERSIAAGTLAAAPADAGWQRTIRASGPQGSGALRDVGRVGDEWGSPGAIVAAGALWLGARAVHDSVRARLGARALEALMLSGTVTGTIKGLAGRARTYDDAHWVSDVVAGAGVGTLSGLTVTRWHDAHPGSWLDRILLGR